MPDRYTIGDRIEVVLRLHRSRIGVAETLRNWGGVLAVTYIVLTYAYCARVWRDAWSDRIPRVRIVRARMASLSYDFRAYTLYTLHTLHGLRRHNNAQGIRTPVHGDRECLRRDA